MSSADDFDGMSEPAYAAPLDDRRWRQRRRWMLATIGLIALLILINLWARMWLDSLWFASVGFGTVFRVEQTTKTLLFGSGFLLTALPVWWSMRLAYRRRPIEAPASAELDSMERYRAVVEPFRRVAFRLVPGLFGLFGASVATTQWQTALLWRNGGSFGFTDPEFHRDLGFYVFTLPWLQFLTTFATLALVLTLIAAVITQYIYGGLSLSREPGQRFTTVARVQLSVTGAILVLVRGAAWWLQRYELTTKDGSLITGIDYTAAHAEIPTKAVMALAAVVCAGLFLATLWSRTWRLPIVGVASLVVCSIVLGAIYPAVVQGRARGAEERYEAPYVARNITATRAAYGLAGMTTTQASSWTATPTRDGLRGDQATVSGIPLLDPTLTEGTFSDQQKVGGFEFSTLTAGRYAVDGSLQPMVLGVRGVDVANIPADQRGWDGMHSVWTHGYGVVSADATTRTAAGDPVYESVGVPPRGVPQPTQPRIYFGKGIPSYAVVGGLAAHEQDPGAGRTTYSGKAGVPLDASLRRLAYAVKYRESNFLSSSVSNDKAKVLEVRDPVDRVRKVAPWLTTDSTPYPIVAGGRIVWVVDGYTTTARYPYAQTVAFGDAASTSVTPAGDRGVDPGSSVNYVRNAVKATVDGYDGTVRLYAWDGEDPILKAWQRAFPGTVEPASAIPADVLPQLRYPGDLFAIQQQVLTMYHNTDPKAFIAGSDVWSVPADPIRGNGRPAPATYVATPGPQGGAPEWSLVSTFVPRGAKQNLVATLRVDADPGGDPQQVRDAYGRLHLTVLPQGSDSYGPQQFQGAVNGSTATAPAFKQTLSQYLTGNAAKLVRGTIVTVPAGGGLLYVEPLYLRSKGTALRQTAVVVGFGKTVAWGDTLDAALNALFGGSSGVKASDAGASTPGASPAPPPASTPSPQLKAAVAEVKKYFDQAQAAMKKGDWDAYGKAQENLRKAIDRLVKLGGVAR
ncbi:UPF0182 family protein [Calidifontibacter sp. DB0510]|uniref:UPF0182 family protein n=1 Tax=Metallococcus carri TaxID=1656884 RepID=A0A967B387_9MICO|nr:UPF0182 family protein [Metallococcus carri]NHN56470.1 UPF0182 family protein [Metallococcus carri]NOP36094.1 UPF0182 family protein [Calidifontibacter sp. DB2511S]